ncbi:thymidine phosphorylase [Candidatus Fermentibacterales bacterium]|nr:thymidine phosphorylase [Candidatus Fermentibacterales bacterium]
MRVTDLIASKRDGLAAPAADLAEFVRGVTDGSVADYQASAWLMACFLNGLSDSETLALTTAMRDSGSVLSWDPDGPPVADKHSTGGVGDKISLALAPLAAVSGLRVPMVSGRSLGHTGGTLDKLESIPGLRVDLSLDELARQVDGIGVAMVGQTDDLAPADRRLYALRDATSTVPSVDPICASILSKKLAEGLDSLVLDVKVGSGAFMKTREEASCLGQLLVSVAGRLGCRASAVITRMSVPLGTMVGNALEVDESLEILRGGGPEDSRMLTLHLAARMLVGAGTCDMPTALRTCEENLRNGRAMSLFERMVESQGGDLSAFETREPARVRLDVAFDRSGLFCGLDAFAVGEAVRRLGGGRFRVEDRVDHSVGWELSASPGSYVSPGDPLGIVHAASGESAAEAAASLRSAVVWDSILEDLFLGEP